MTRTARIAGAWYLGLAITGILGFLLVRPEIYVDGDAATTLANLRGKEALAQLGVALEMTIVVTQARGDLVLKVAPCGEQRRSVFGCGVRACKRGGHHGQCRLPCDGRHCRRRQLPRTCRRRRRDGRCAVSAQHQCLGNRRLVLRAVAHLDGVGSH